MNDLCKECVNCKTVRPRNQFHKQTGATGWCKPCKEAANLQLRKQAEPTIHSKRCSLCMTCQPLSYFYKHRKGVSARCKSCTQATVGSQAKWTEANNGVLRAFYPTGGAHTCQVAMPHRSIASINKQASRLGIQCEVPALDGTTKFLPRGCQETMVPIPFQELAEVAAYRTFQNTPVPVYVTGNLCATLRMAA